MSAPNPPNPYAARIGEADMHNEYRTVVWAILAVAWEIKQLRSELHRVVRLSESLAAEDLDPGLPSWLDDD